MRVRNHFRSWLLGVGLGHVLAASLTRLWPWARGSTKGGTPTLESDQQGFHSETTGVLFQRYWFGEGSAISNSV